MEKSINENDIKNVFGSDCLILRYSELKGIKNLDKQLAKTPCIFILYNYTPDYGHWTLLFKQESNVEFFDSYGTLPDSQQKKWPQKLKNRYGMSHPEVVRLLLTSKYPIEYNNHKLQSDNTDIKTCGRWCMLRALTSQVGIDEFADGFKYKRLSPDGLVTKITGGLFYL